MSACAMLTYSNVTPSAWSCAQQVASQYGVTISSNSGSADKDGFTIAWNYNPGAQSASIQCTDSPWYVPCTVINGKINDLVEGCLSQEKIEQRTLVAV